MDLPYLAEKLKIGMSTLNKIDWNALEKATTKSPFTSMKTIPQLLHRWLPTRAHPSMSEYFVDQEYCPRCKQDTETNEHFLWCPMQRTEWIEEYRKAICKHVDTTIHEELINAVTAVLNKQIPKLTDKYKKIENEQSEIGWNQLVYGRFSKAWSEEYNNETETADGEKWVSMNIIKIWKHISKRWDSRCELVHSESEEAQLELTVVLDKQLEKRYDDMNNLPHTERQVYHKSIEEMKEATNRTKRDWLQRTKRIITQGKRRLRANSTRPTQTIISYFNAVARVPHQSNINRVSRQSTSFMEVGTNTDIISNREKRRTRKLPNVTLQSEYHPP
jgi:hypothetical protein